MFYCPSSVVKKRFLLGLFVLLFQVSFSQLKWQNVDSLFQPLPASVHVYFTTDQLDTGAFRAYYLEADLKDKNLQFDTDTSHDRRLIPSVFYQRNNKPLVVINCTFFSYETNRSINTVIKDGKLVAYNLHTINGRGKDTFTYRHPYASAFGISKKRNPDVVWLYTDSSKKYPYELVRGIHEPVKDSVMRPTFLDMTKKEKAYQQIEVNLTSFFRKWKMQTAIGGGPVLLHNGDIRITNNEELKFAGKAINDKHPRTAIGYTKSNKLIILMVEGRNPVAHGATLGQEAQIFKDLGCWEALNLDGGGSSCMLVNGRETIKVSDSLGQRPVPAVFLIHTKNRR